MSAEFIVGEIYSRRQHIHDRFGGQRQSGIVTPKKYPAVFLFTGKGVRHGYVDTESEDGTFQYFGEGQKGDMTLTKGNKAIYRHAADGKDLLLFRMLGGGRIQFVGPFNCAGYEERVGLDQHKASRKTLVFHLVPVSGPEATAAVEPRPTSASLEELRQKAREAAGPAKKGTSKNSKRDYFLRSQDVKLYVLARAKGVCESCKEPAPFITQRGTPYLEPHHIRRLTDDGPDDAAFMGAICPNCHRDIHHGKNGKARNHELQKFVTAVENALDSRATI